MYRDKMVLETIRNRHLYISLVWLCVKHSLQIWNPILFALFFKYQDRTKFLKIPTMLKYWNTSKHMTSHMLSSSILSSWYTIPDKLRWTRHQVHFSATTAKFTETSRMIVHVVKYHNALARTVVCLMLASIPLGHTAGKSTKITNLLVC